MFVDEFLVQSMVLEELIGEKRILTLTLMNIEGLLEINALMSKIKSIS